MDTIVSADPYALASLSDLERVYAKPSSKVIEKQTDYITAPGRAFIAGSPFLILATASDAGIDCSPKGDTPGFVQLLDDRTLLIPDRPGNNRIDGMKNIIANPKVGIIFIAPGSNSTYRVNGSAQISVDPDLLARFEVDGKLPRAVVVVTVEEAFNHCPKAFVRAKLWDGGSQDSDRKMPTLGDFAAFRDGGDAEYAKEYDENYTARMPEDLY